MPHPHDELRDLERRWIEAEINADVVTLDQLASEDFRLVGPAGFVLDKQQWLERYRHHDLITQSVRREDTNTRIYGRAAVTIARHIQQAQYQGHAADGEFRATHIAIYDRAQWRLAGVHLSAIGGAPSFARATVQQGK